MAQTVITIDATIGGADTNSYLSLVDANDLIHQRPFHSNWDSITDDDEKNAALVWATRMLSHYEWKGSIASQDQKQAWPRSGIYDKDGRAQLITTYPEWLTTAFSELAFYIATEDRLSDSGTEGFSKIKIGSIDLTIDKTDRTGLIPDYILDDIRPWLKSSKQFNASVVRV